jgi:transcription elongation factor SPT6
MAENALELDEDDVADDHPSKSVVKLMLDDSPEEKLNELNLDDFADNLRELRHVEKRYALHVIKDEIASPGRDRRDDFRPPTDWEVLTMLSGETPRTLLPGFIIAGHVWRVRDKDVNVRLDSGVEAMVDIRYVADHPPESCNQVARIGSVQAMIIGVFPEKMLVELSMRKTELDMGDAEQRRVRAEEPYDWERAQADKAARDKKKRTEVNRLRRQIDHPNFFNMNAAQAEQYLATQQRGDCVIRPSSLGIDHLAVTWKVDDGVYQHLGRSPSLCALSRLASFLTLLCVTPLPSRRQRARQAQPAERRPDLARRQQVHVP